MVVRTAAKPMIFQSATATGCTASASNLLCVVAGTGPTTLQTFANAYQIGLNWPNPDSTATVKYDAISMKIDLIALAPSGSQETCGPTSTTFAACTSHYTFTTGSTTSQLFNWAPTTATDVTTAHGTSTTQCLSTAVAPATTPCLTSSTITADPTKICT